MNRTLIVVDVQNDFLPGGSLEVREGDQVIPVINRLQEQFDLVVATQDWHPENHGSFASNHEGKQPLEKTDLNGLEQILWPDHCIQESRGAEFAENLDMKRVEAIIRKGMDPGIDSYSGFYDNGHKKTTGLADYLRGRNMDELYVTGLAGDVCVYFTVLDALKEGFTTSLIIDATRPVNKKGFDDTVNDMKNQGAQILKSAEIS